MGEQTEHIKTRQKIRGITEISRFNELIDAVMLPPKYKQLLEMFYLKDMSFSEIGEELGVEEITAKNWHRKALKKIGQMI